MSMDQANEVPAPAPRKLIVKFGKPLGSFEATPQSTPPQVNTTSPMQLTLPTVVSSSAPKLGRLVIKTSTPVVPTPPPPVEVVPLEVVNPLRNRRGEIIDLEARARKREMVLDVEMMPGPKRRKEVELEEEFMGARGVGENRRKNWVPMKKMLNNALKKLIDLDGYKFFYSPVSEKDAPGYFAFIKKPMDFSMMRRKLVDDKYAYWSLFVEDFELICQNCISFNQPNSIYWNEAKTLLLEGKKYLKVQATKINPELLTPPSSYDDKPHSSSAPTSDTPLHRVQPTSTTPKIAFQTPLEPLAPPPPISVPKIPPVPVAPTIATKDHMVAKRTPQQQIINRNSNWPAFVPQSSIRSHWAHSIPTFIHHTRGYPYARHRTELEGQPTTKAMEFSDFTQDMPNNANLSAQEAYYLKQFGVSRCSTSINGAKSMTETLSQAARNRFQEIVELLSASPESLCPNSLEGTLSISKAMDIDTTSVAMKKDVLTVNADDLSELNSLRSCLTSSHIDLSFLDKLFHYDSKSDPLQSFPSASISGMLDRGAILIPSLNASLCHRRLPTAPSLEEAKKMNELAANLVSTSAKLPKQSINTSKPILDTIRMAVEIGLPSIPDVTPIVSKHTVKYE